MRTIETAAVTINGKLHTLILCAVALYFFVNVQRVAVPGAIFNPLQVELGISAPQVTALGYTFMYIYALTQLIVGALVNRYGGRRVIALGAALFCAGSLLFVWSHSLWMLYISRAITGLGAGSIYLGLEQETHRTYHRHYPVALSLVIMTGYAGGIVANAPLVACVERYGFRSVLGWVGIATCLFYALFIMAKTGLPSLPIREVSLRAAPFKRVLLLQHNRMIYLFGGINFGLYYVLQSVIGKKFLEDYAGMTSSSAAWVLSIMGTISAFSGLFLVLLSGKAALRGVFFCRLAGIIGIAIFILLTTCVYYGIHGAIFIYLFSILSLTSSLSGIMLPLLRQANQLDVADVAVSLMNFSLYVFVAIFGSLVGFLMNLFPPELRGDLLIYGRMSYLAVFAGLGICSIISAYCAMQIKNIPYDCKPQYI